MAAQFVAFFIYCDCLRIARYRRIEGRLSISWSDRRREH